MQHEHCVYEISLSIWWEKAFHHFSAIIPVLVSVFSLLVLPVPTANFSIQVHVEENKSPVKKMVEYSRNQSWTKVKGLYLYML